MSKKTRKTKTDEHHGVVDYVADLEALEYRQSFSMPEEDQEFIEHMYESLGADSSDSPLDEELE